jgi:uncharacterized protein (DUF305 family)
MTPTAVRSLDRRPRAARALAGVLLAGAIALGGGTGLAGVTGPAAASAAAQATQAAASCATAGTPTAGTPAADHAGHGGMATPAADHAGHHGMATPAAGHAGHDMTASADLPFDQVYIDMMLPHHASVVALAEAATPYLEDPALQAIAAQIVTTQQAEQGELTALRVALYGSGEPAPMADIMPAMAALMPEAHDLMMGDMDQMDATALVARFCAEGTSGAPGAADRLFIDLVIPHHESAIAASEPALTMAASPELRAFAQNVIDGQQAEIDQMEAIRATLPA